MAIKETKNSALDRELALLESTASSLSVRIAKIKELVRVEREQTRAENAKMRATREFCEAIEKRVAEINLHPDETVTLNLRGTIIITSRRLLTRVDGSFLQEMFCGRHVLHTVAPQGAVYLDRDPVVFASLLGTMEHPALLPTDPHLRSLLRMEAEFWGLHFLVMIMDNFQVNMQAQMGFAPPGFSPVPGGAVLPQPPMAEQVVPPRNGGPQQRPALSPAPTAAKSPPASAPVKTTQKGMNMTVLEKHSSSPGSLQTTPGPQPAPTAGPATSSSSDSITAAARKAPWSKPASSVTPLPGNGVPPTNGHASEETSAQNENGPVVANGASTSFQSRRVADMGPPAAPTSPNPTAFAAAAAASDGAIQIGPVRDYGEIRTHKGILGCGKKEFNDPFAVAVHADTVYVVEALGQQVSAWLREDHTRIWVEKLPNEGQGLAVAPDGTLFMTCKDNKVYMRKPGGEKKRFGGEGKGPGQFNDPLGIAVDRQGRLLVADHINQRIQVLTQDGKYLSEWKLPQRPWGVAVGPSGDVYVTLMDRFEVACLDPVTGEITCKWGGQGKGTGQFYGPSHMCVDGHGQVLVADTDNQRVLAFTSTGVFLCDIGGIGRMANPRAVATAWDTGVMYVANAVDGSVKVY